MTVLNSEDQSQFTQLFEAAQNFVLEKNKRRDQEPQKPPATNDDLLDSDDQDDQSEHHDGSLQNYLDAKNRKSDKAPPLFSLKPTLTQDDLSKQASQNHLRDIDEYLEFYENL